MSVSVRSILDVKGRDVVTIGPNVTLTEAARILDEHKIGAVVVVGMEDRIVGIFTERDLVRSIGRAGASALDQPVSAMMTAVGTKDSGWKTEFFSMQMAAKNGGRPFRETEDLSKSLIVNDSSFMAQFAKIDASFAASTCE